MKVLITGASGMVGRELVKLIPDASCPSSSELDLMDSNAVKVYMDKGKFDYVIHLAAYVGSLHDNIDNRTLYFDKNILMNTIVTKYSYESGVKNFLGILSTCIYPNNVTSFPIKEESLHDGAPHADLMSYAYAKRSHAVQLTAYKEAFGVNYNYLIPCNLYGLVSEAHKGRSHFVNDLIQKIIVAKRSNQDHITLFGDGSPLRQFMYSGDLARVIKTFVDEQHTTSFNVAPDVNLSVNNIALVALNACDAQHMTIKYDASKPNGQQRKDVDTVRLKSCMPTIEFRDLAAGIRNIYDIESLNES
ncbi:NAD-dependent epimerase/dehydratase family protein [Gammaproteobacteria bacterium]|nr:NAD-dependent epimerase/dehydratase family protein [Gammaproteobacteria bacterium]